MNNDDDDILKFVIDSTEAAQLWGISVQRVRQLASEGKITAKKLERAWAIDKRQDNPKTYKK